jgi:hypothetical protein
MIRVAASRRIVTWSAIVGYGLVVSGLPLPVGVAGPNVSSAAAKRLSAKDRAVPFPCMDKPCGCATAAQCFTDCCCNTPAETLAWAKAHDVDPAVLAALERRAVAPVKAAAETSCCSANKSCCEVAAKTPLESAADPEGPAEEPVSERSLSLRAMLACGGIVAEWLSCGASLPPPCVVMVTGLGFVECRPCLDECSTPSGVAPDVPPPRAG